MSRFHALMLVLAGGVTVACGMLARPFAQDAAFARKPDGCADGRPIFEDGDLEGWLCADDGAREGLTVVDLSAGFVPPILADERDPYREVYLALASERFDDLPSGVERERFVEVFGIPPTFEVLRARMREEDRYACHEAIDNSTFEAVTRTVRPRNTLDDAERAALTTAQAHLRCDGLLDERARDGVYDWRTAEALRAWQRRHLVLTTSGAFDAPTRRSMTLDLREADFLAVLRTLRERVVAATGLIEDGSAPQEPEEVLGRRIDPPGYVANGGWPPIAGAPDLIAQATEAAARALGWTSPEAFVEHEEGRAGLVALPLPPRPRYHGQHMDLRVELDRGDVVYDLNDPPPVERRPVLTLYARDGDREVALVRWVTTIGGWAEELGQSGQKGLRYKESPTGPRVLRELWAAPSWMPPPTTPDEELLRPADGRWLPRTELLGPGHRSAYGLTMLVHHEPVGTGDDGEPIYRDEGIRTHGSVSYRSILAGTSHGCHRLYNHLAVRLAGFVLAHRNHVPRGPQEVGYSRTLQHAGVSRAIHVTTRGTLYELDPPVPIEVLPGRVIGQMQRPSQRLVPTSR